MRWFGALKAAAVSSFYKRRELLSLDSGSCSTEALPKLQLKPCFVSPSSTNKSAALAVIPIASVRRRWCFGDCFPRWYRGELLPWHTLAWMGRTWVDASI